MAFLIGTDEAGYGPNLGPLTVGGTLWWVPDSMLSGSKTIDLYSVLGPAIVSADIPKSKSGEVESIRIGDSKALFSSRGSLAALEQSLLAMLAICEQPFGNFFELVESLTGLTAIQLADEAGYDWSEQAIPVDADTHLIELLANNAASCFTETGVRCLNVSSVMVFPSDFNEGLKRCGNKASLLSSVTCRLVRRLMEIARTQYIELSDSQQHVRFVVACDKHGGRAHYAGLLQQEMTESFVQVVEESRPVSEYRWSEKQEDVSIRFIAKGERELPIALASMAAKYLRELSMEAWNRFWTKQLPELAPTAGYPQDAKRFKSQISDLQQRLKLNDQLIWREK